MLVDTVAGKLAGLSDEERAAIQEQVGRLLADSHFSQSRRFPSFLRYVVEKTLAGQEDALKERTLGVEIFGRRADYDTASDPIVRVTAAEIRKRIAQYYQDPGHESELRVSLPPGSYVPQFHWPETAKHNGATQAAIISLTPAFVLDEPPKGEPRRVVGRAGFGRLLPSSLPCCVWAVHISGSRHNVLRSTFFGVRSSTPTSRALLRRRPKRVLRHLTTRRARPHSPNLAERQFNCHCHRRPKSDHPLGGTSTIQWEEVQLEGRRCHRPQAGFCATPHDLRRRPSTMPGRFALTPALRATTSPTIPR